MAWSVCRCSMPLFVPTVGDNHTTLSSLSLREVQREVTPVIIQKTHIHWHFYTHVPKSISSLFFNQELHYVLFLVLRDYIWQHFRWEKIVVNSYITVFNALLIAVPFYDFLWGLSTLFIVYFMSDVCSGMYHSCSISGGQMLRKGPPKGSIIKGR